MRNPVSQGFMALKTSNQRHPCPSRRVPQAPICHRAVVWEHVFDDSPPLVLVDLSENFYPESEGHGSDEVVHGLATSRTGSVNLTEDDIHLSLDTFWQLQGSPCVPVVRSRATVDVAHACMDTVTKTKLDQGHQRPHARRYVLVPMECANDLTVRTGFEE